MIPCLSIAGFDGSGGAGMQADLKTFTALGCYGMATLTVLPVQNTCGVRSIHEIPLTCIEEQLDAIFDDIPPQVIKIGMLYTQEIIEMLADFLSQRACGIPIILDPVIVSTQGNTLLKPEAIHALKHLLIPLANLITPNLPEAKSLTNSHNKEAMQSELIALGCEAVLLTGGHETSEYASDWFMDQSGYQRTLSCKRLITNNTHGTGCTLSAAISAYRAKGNTLFDSCALAKSFLTQALKSSQNLSLGKGKGPVNHSFKMED